MEKSLERNENIAKIERETENRFAFSAILIAAEIAAYILLWTSSLDLYVLKFCLVLIPFVYSIGSLSFRSLRGFITQIALAFTLAADCVLLFSPQRLFLALVLFLIVQICHSIRLTASDDRSANIVFLYVRAVLIGALFGIIASYIGAASALPYLAALYAALLIVNTVQAFAKRRSAAFSFGLLCFFACDLLVLFAFIAQNAILPFSPIASRILTEYNLPWIFYPPAQMLIAISSPRKNALGKSNEIGVAKHRVS